MWMLYFLSDDMLAWAIHGILIIAIIGTIAGFILNKTVIKIIFSILLLSGIYFEGSYTTEMIWRNRVAEVEARVAIAEAKSQQVNTVIQEKIVEKIKIVKERVVVNHNVIKKHKEVINAECKIPDIAFQIYNTAVNYNGAKHE